MPYRKKRYRKRRPRRRRRRSNQNKLVIYPSVARPWGNKFKATLRYSDLITLQDSVLSYRSQIYRANSVYDPDFTGTGAQPRYFDQLSALFQHVYVIGSKCRVRAVNANTETQMIGCMLKRDSTVVTTGIDFREDQYSNTRVMSSNGGTPEATVSMTYKPAFLTGCQKGVLTHSELRHGASGNPQDVAYFHVNGYNLHDPLDPLSSIRCVIDIDYICMFVEPITPPGS